MRIISLLSLVTLLLANSVISQANTCHEACGGFTENDCADFKDPTSSPEKCYSCNAGYVGGSGYNDGKGLPCEKGTCRSECAACKNTNDSTECYLCSSGFYDPIQDSTRATPCVACHPSCGSCSGST